MSYFGVHQVVIGKIIGEMSVEKITKQLSLNLQLLKPTSFF